MIIRLTLDINKSEGRFSSLEEAIELRQTDAVAYAISASIREDGAVLDLTGCTVRFYATRPDGAAVIEEATVASAADGTVFYTIPKEFTEVVGNVQNAYFRVTSNGGYSASTESIAFRVKPGAFIEATGGDYAPDIDKVIALMEEQRIAHATNEENRAEEWLDLKAASASATVAATTAAGNVTSAMNSAAALASMATSALREVSAITDYEADLDVLARLMCVDYLILNRTVYASGVLGWSGSSATLKGAAYSGSQVSIKSTSIQDKFSR